MFVNKLSDKIGDFLWDLLVGDGHDSKYLMCFLRSAFAVLFLGSFASNINFPTVGLQRGFVGLIFIICGLATVFGVYPRMSAALTGLGLLYMTMIWGWNGDQDIFKYHHPYLLANALIIMSLTSTHQYFSLCHLKIDVVPEISAASLLRLQTVVIYFFAVLSKSLPEYLNGYRMVQILMEVHTGSVNAMNFQYDKQSCLLAWLSAFTELSLFVTLMLKKVRFLAVGGLMLFHFMLFINLPVRGFSTFMILLLLNFLPSAKVETHLRYFFRT